jgi:hypothetical protein
MVMETIRPNPLAALTWMVSTLLGAAIIISLLIVVLVKLDHRSEPVLAEHIRLEALFTDEAQVMEGPTVVTPGRVELGVVNTTNSRYELAVCYFTDEAEWMKEQFRLGIGENTDAAPGDLMPVGQLIDTVGADPGADFTTHLTMANGYYIFDWVTPRESRTADHVWRVAAVEVVDRRGAG